MMEKIKALAALVEKETSERLIRESAPYGHSPEEAVLIHGKSSIFTRIVPGRKYTKVDVGTSGKYMIDMETGIIYGIKGYGKVHKGHVYGTLDTINEFYWGGYTASRKAA